MVPSLKVSDNFPVILQTTNLLASLEWLLEHCTEDSLVTICSSLADFEIQVLMEALGNPDAFPQPTLHNLFQSRNIKINFCPSVQSLHAFLSTRHSKKHRTYPISEDRDITPLMIILNPIQLHEPTSSFSAQGLSRFFAHATTVSNHINHPLVIIEVPTPRNTRSGETGEIGHDGLEELTQVNLDNNGTLATHGESDVDPWKIQVPILNATTRSFGPGERGWVGRTVEIRRIAAAWCTFQKHS